MLNQLEPTPRSLYVESIGNTLVIRLEGPCDTECTRALDGVVSRIPNDSGTTVIFDATDVKYIDTPGFRWITTLFRRLQEIGGQLIVAGLKGPAERAFKLLQLDKFIPSTANVEAALARLRPGDKGKS
jgi:anti-anti-sigma factor